MKSVLVIGAGRFGRHVCKKLNELGHRIMVVDCVEKRVDDVLPYVTKAQIGDSTDEEFLRSLGVRNFDLCIVTIGDNFQNSLETTSLLKELGAPMVVSRAARDVQMKFLLRNGADQVVYPERHMAEWTAIRYSANHVFDYVDLGHEYAILEVEVPKSWIGRRLSDLEIRKKHQINILAFKYGNGELDINVTPEHEFVGNGTLLVLGNIDKLHDYFDM